MSTRIAVNRLTPLGSQVQDVVNKVREAQNAIKRADEALTSAMSGDTFTALGGELGGLNGVDAQAVWTILRNCRASLDGAPMAELARLDQTII
jgi:hypothetical protein